jgi:aspartate/methionine/tyrosine aminotransferase
LLELRAAVAEHLLGNGLAFSPTEEVLITGGGLGAVQLAFDAFVNRGDRVVLPDPISPIYPLAARTRGARVRWLPTEMEDGRTRFRLDHLARALRGARLLVLCSPNNPTGGIVAPEDLEQIAWWANRYDVLLLSDDVFGRFWYESAPVRVGTLPSARQRTLTVGSASKGHALAAARVGWLAAYRHLLRPCLATAALRCPFVPTLSQQVALAALRAGDGTFEPIRTELDARRRYTAERLSALGLGSGVSQGAFFAWVSVKELGTTGRAFAEDLLTKQRLRVVPGDLFGPSGANHVRLSYAPDDGRLEEGLNRLGEHVQALRGQAPEPARRAA